MTSPIDIISYSGCWTAYLASHLSVHGTVELYNNVVNIRRPDIHQLSHMFICIQISNCSSGCSHHTPLLQSGCWVYGWVVYIYTMFSIMFIIYTYLCGSHTTASSLHGLLKSNCTFLHISGTQLRMLSKMVKKHNKHCFKIQLTSADGPWTFWGVEK